MLWDVRSCPPTLAHYHRLNRPSTNVQKDITPSSLETSTSTFGPPGTGEMSGLLKWWRTSVGWPTCPNTSFSNPVVTRRGDGYGGWEEVGGGLPPNVITSSDGRPTIGNFAPFVCVPLTITSQTIEQLLLKFVWGARRRWLLIRNDQQNSPSDSPGDLRMS